MAKMGQISIRKKSRFEPATLKRWHNWMTTATSLQPTNEFSRHFLVNFIIAVYYVKILEIFQQTFCEFLLKEFLALIVFSCLVLLLSATLSIFTEKLFQSLGFESLCFIGFKQNDWLKKFRAANQSA